MTIDNIQTDLREADDGRLDEQRPDRPRLLFLAYTFPPLSAPGSQRTGHLAKYLARLGWEVTVVTPHPSHWRRTDSPEKIDRVLRQEGIHRITTGLRWRCLDPSYARFWNNGLGWVVGGICRKIARRLSIEDQAGWPQEIENACRGLRKGDVDVVLATLSPFVSFRAARFLGKRLGVPFVLDYRDLWSNNPHVLVPRPRRIVKEEESLLHDCAAVTTVSSSLALSLQRHFPSVKEVHVVSNGYDPEVLSSVRPVDFAHFAILYAGSFYPPKRVITPLMKALQKLGSSRDDNLPEWRFHYLGAGQDHVIAEAEVYGLRDRVISHGHLSHKEALSAVAGADVSVVITSIQEEGSVEDRGIVTGKVFESLGLGTRVLLIAPVGSDAEAVVEGTNCGRRFSGNQTEEIANYLREMMTSRQPKPVPPVRYSWPEIATSLNELMRRIVNNRRGEP